MNGLTLLHIFLWFIGLCPFILIAVWSIIYLKGNNKTIGYLLLIGTLITICVSIFHNVFFFIPYSALPLTTATRNIISSVEGILGVAGSFCFAIGFYKLIKSIEKTEQEN